MKIGLRIPGAAQKLPFSEFCNWCSDCGFDGVDMPKMDASSSADLAEHGLGVGTVDINTFSGLFGSDDEARLAASESCAVMDNAVTHGCHTLFCVLVPRNSRTRAQNLDRLKDTFGGVIKHAEANNVRIAVEGWPGPGPHYPALAVTPETVRELIKAFPSPVLRLNYDPSHLIRIGVDYLRFLREFGDRVVHCHGKDANFDGEALYLHGNLGPTLREPKAFGEDWWRYTIPGEGLADWGKIFAELTAIGYDDYISIELEDFRYHNTWEKEAEGLLKAKRLLQIYM